ncbi:uncharacterized protein LOC143860392 [Tasmannia lanceolata]|uniref:uncharacterized protein LOC143860392 n=1 Tax=Tasmannia lanceolata TaxID=3420 RepID=UPI0040637F0D
MPALQMKSKSSVGCLRERNSLHACHQSNKISKSSRFQVKISPQTAELGTSIQNQRDVSSKIEASDQNIQIAEDVDHQEMLAGATLQFQKSPLSSFDSSSVGRLESVPAACPSILETIFSPVFEPNEVHCKPINNNISDPNDEPFDLAVDDSDAGSSSSSDYQTCNVSDFNISDMNIASLSFDGNTGLDDVMEANHCLNYESLDPDLMFDMAERYMILPFLEETVETSNFNEGESFEEVAMNSNDTCLYLAIQQMKPSDQKTDINYHSGDPDELDGFDPHLFIRNLPDLSEVVPSLWPVLLPKETRIRKPVTLVLDLDETLVHSTLDHCDGADFTFPVFFNLKEHTVYVRQRPYLQIFLERVAEMFEIIVFTASQSIYAEQLLDILDPEQKLISRRVYRESCIFSDGSYMKDLTVLGLDLAKVVIIDNSPQVFRLQVNNGIPIQTWFDDPSDCELISLLPFLETLVDADDVRPIIAKRFSNNE